MQSPINSSESNIKHTVSKLSLCLTLITMMFVIGVVYVDLYIVPQVSTETDPGLYFVPPVDISDCYAGGEIYLEPGTTLADIIDELEEEKPEILEGKDLYISYVYEICEGYEGIDPYVVIAQMYFESRYTPDAKNGNYYGLMQVHKSTHSARMEKLGVTDLWDPYSNILVAVDLLDDIYHNYAGEDIGYTLMLYSMSWDSAKKLHANGQLSEYASKVLVMAEELKGGSD